MKPSRWLYGLVGAVPAFGLGVWVAGLAAQPATFDVVRARSFQLVDDRGQVRGELHLGGIDGSGNFRLSDASGRVRVKLGTSVEGNTGLLLLDDDMNPAVSIGVGKAQDAAITLTSRSGQTRVVKP